jgi:tectonic-1/3
VIANLSTSCSTALNATAMLTNLYIAIAPTIVTTTTMASNLFTNINIRNVTSDTTNGTLNYVPSTIYSTSGGINYCQNAITRVAYIIYYNTGNISKVEADVWLTTVSSDAPYLTQYTSVTYVYGASTSVGLIRNNSGSPGYRRGSVVIGGALTSVTAVTNTQGTTQQSAILQSVNGLTIYRGDDCNQLTPLSVTFDQDLISACKLTLTLDQLRTLCTNNDIPILTHVDSAFSHLGRFGDANLYNTNDWVTITKADGPTATWDESTSTCNALAAGTQYEMVVAQQGSTTNGQWKIVGVRRYRFAQKWRFSDDGSTTKSFWVQWRVRFIHLQGQSSGKSVAPIPNLLPRLPQDVFYPFTLSSSASLLSLLSSSSWLQLIFVIMCILY